MKHYLDQEGQRVGWLLTELEKQTTERLSDEAMQGLLDEVRCHIDAAIRARLELGMEPIEAEREAVEAFGAPQDYVEDLLRVHEHFASKHTLASTLLGDRRVTLAFWAINLYCCAWLTFGQMTNFIPAIGVGLMYLLVPFAWFSYKARRIQIPSILMSSVLACGMLALGLSYTWRDGLGVYPRTEISQHLVLGHLGEETRVLNRLIEPLQHIAELHHAHPQPQLEKDLAAGTDLGLRKIPVLQAVPRFGTTPLESTLLEKLPNGRNGVTPHAFEVAAKDLHGWDMGRSMTLSFRTAKDLASADIIWKLQGQPLLQALSMRRQSAETRIKTLSQEKVSVSDIVIPPMERDRYVAWCINWFALWAAINFVFGGLGWFLSLPSSVRRRRLPQ